MQAKQHRWTIDESEYRRHESRRGRRHAFSGFAPQHTALVVVDMVPFFVEGSAFARGIVAKVNELVGVFRAADATVGWVLPDPEPHASLAEEFYGAEVARRYGLSGGQGELGSRLWPGLDCDDADVYEAKTSSSAFFPGRCRLHERLSEHGIENVVLAGTVANVCVESSARDARTLGYRVVAAADAIAAPTDEVLNASLRTVYRSFGDVRSNAEIAALLNAAA